ncbi:2-oxoacid:acceptor oxidoreductase family protein [Thermoanaerobacterium sp. DL9XJH110]|uniref:2-oxoacid:acceptor oxidoreductase family protein n=1 Tax=Thermoanaerobacterium sp. DL9XJH110 TaxID=3386643 RepID=UPI003BB5A65A
MKGRIEVVLAGVGGQGLILMGKILGEAAALFEGKNAVQTQSYGVASRGGFSKSEVVISDDEIAYPEVLEPDIVFTLSQPAFDLYCDKIGSDGLLIYDSDTIRPGVCSGKAEGYPITKTAVSLNNIKILNMIALGILVRRTGIVGYDSVKRSLEKNSPAQFRQLNFRAFEEGYKMAGRI